MIMVTESKLYFCTVQQIQLLGNSEFTDKVKVINILQITH